MAERIIALVPSAGSGKRFGKDKAYVELKGVPVLIRTLMALERIKEIVEIIPVLRKEVLEEAVKLIESYGLKKVKQVAPGGRERFHSVYNGLRLIKDENSLVLVHDGVRPLVTETLVRRLIDGLSDFDGVVPVVAVKDTVKEVKQGMVVKTLDRAILCNVQTPQLFRFSSLRDAYLSAHKSSGAFTDDAQVVEAWGGRVAVVEGDYRNIKITTPEDLKIAELFYTQMQRSSG
ncbi:MAG: 2-C-methyl-D-erythritol 4-phosphate cytidylyltransferase [Nitrospirae bacterium]|nr:MAG: 2-C-methyl-D-erythritol 4-phosphate cytidylyltransferase [Nitrospirota bacterium]